MMKPHLLSCCATDVPVFLSLCNDGLFNSGGALSDLSGVKRSPVLLCVDREDHIEGYVIALIEPVEA